MALSSRHGHYRAIVNRLADAHYSRQAHRYNRHQGPDQHRPGARRR